MRCVHQERPDGTSELTKSASRRCLGAASKSHRESSPAASPGWQLRLFTHKKLRQGPEINVRQGGTRLDFSFAIFRYVCVTWCRISKEFVFLTYHTFQLDIPRVCIIQLISSRPIKASSRQTGRGQGIMSCSGCVGPRCVSNHRLALSTSTI